MAKHECKKASWLVCRLLTIFSQLLYASEEQLSAVESVLQPFNNLALLLHAVPAFVDHLCSESVSALLSCDRQLYCAVHSSVHKVTAPNFAKLKLLDRHDWLGLTVIILCKSSSYTYHWSETIKLDVLATFQFEQHDASRTAFFVRSKQTGSIAGRKLLTALSFRRVLPSTRDEASLQVQLGLQFAASEWDITTKLDTQGEILGDAIMAPLLANPWPMLKRLNLSSTELGTGSIKALVQASFGCLTHLVLAGNKLDELAMQQVVQASWPCLRFLDLSDNGLCAGAMAHLANGKWPELWTLQLHDNDIGACGVALLMKGRWPYLRWLTLSQSEACAETVDMLQLDARSHPNSWEHILHAEQTTIMTPNDMDFSFTVSHAPCHHSWHHVDRSSGSAEFWMFGVQPASDLIWPSLDVVVFYQRL